MDKSKRMKIGFSFSLLVAGTLAFYQSHVIASVAIDIFDYQEISAGLYVDPLFTAEEQAQIASNTVAARNRIASFYGDLTATPILIVSSSDERSAKFFRGPLDPGRTYNLPWNQYIPIAPAGNNIDVLAHELVHAETYHRLGFLNSLKSPPMWFIEGVAMQVDFRESRARSYISQGHVLPPVSSLETANQFMSGDRALNYAAAKVEISTWLSSGGYMGLFEFLAKIRNGADFYELFYANAM
ncbi:MAG: hypothetical protein GKR91_12540 [Pseudomonadales bacterium]|nr:hypothetical protein [Pseudomonadales bacterium]